MAVFEYFCQWNMKSMAKHIVQWMQRWGVKVAWLAVLVALVVGIAVRMLGGKESRGISPAMVDSLQCIAPGELQRIDYRTFRVYYNNDWHLPACVIYELTPTEAQGNLPRATRWLSDSTVTGCAVTGDYVHSGYDRGHIAPAGDMKWDSVAMQESFTMTNVCPQNHHLNEGGWARLEDKVREWVVRDGGLIVIAGPIVAPTDTATLGETRVRVPSAFYKIILAHRVEPMRVAAFIYPNAPADGHLIDYLTTVDHIEHLTGLDFFPTLPPPQQTRLESTQNLNPWLH